MKIISQKIAAFFLIVIIIISSFSSCRKEIPTATAPESYLGLNYNDLFEGFWNGMNNNYLFWSVDTTNWDRVYTTYKPLFAKLKISDAGSDTIAQNYFKDMTAGLMDSHYTLTFLSGDQISPSLNRKIKADTVYSLPATFFSSITAKNYISAATLKKGTDGTSGNSFTLITGTISNSVLYLYVNKFAFSQMGQNTTPVLNDFLKNIKNLPSNIKGIVIDLRGNPGGEYDGLNEIVGRMITKPLTYGHIHYKSGIGRLDYTPWAPAIVTPQADAVNITVPIVGLVDHTSVSMAEITAMAIKALPNGKIVGTTTWGAHGGISPVSSLDNGGKFTVGHTALYGSDGYLSVYTSSMAFKYIDGNIYEGKGFPPDIWVPETQSAYLAGRDIQLEAAINYIKSK